MTEDDCVVLEEGPQCRVLGLRLADRSCPAQEFLASLGTAAQTQFKSRLEVLTQRGWLRSPELMRDLQDNKKPVVWEVKVNDGPGYRLYMIRRDDDWIATHGCKKPKDKNVPKEAAHARSLYKEWES